MMLTAIQSNLSSEVESKIWKEKFSSSNDSGRAEAHLEGQLATTPEVQDSNPSLSQINLFITPPSTPSTKWAATSLKTSRKQSNDSDDDGSDDDGDDDNDYGDETRCSAAVDDNDDRARFLSTSLIPKQMTSKSTNKAWQQRARQKTQDYIFYTKPETDILQPSLPLCPTSAPLETSQLELFCPSAPLIVRTLGDIVRSTNH
ncbi:hypothetical protein PoB_006873200 [Plakobranchus ocellatus]|uniref:Uncharacterized protein n=1 Tax=Plakobranchus ocellatus TaxID=259542 RepID=A0AAV4DDA4_9GAST|nr:hypothetical protein PoB_006873200 [Plakobranchus ocellatus]